MNSPADGDDVPRVARRKSWLPSLIWSIPLAAFIIVAYLGIQALANRGELVTVTFEHAPGARPGDTQVLYQGVQAGKLVKIVPNKDGRRLDFKLRLVPEAKPGLNSNARFWLIGATPSVSDLSSLKAAVAGVAIGYAPGEGGTPMRSFQGLEKEPVVLPGARGTRYELTARTLGSISEGTVLLFRGQPIGKVTAVRFHGRAGFRLEVFVFQPYDALIVPEDRFWKASPVRLSLAGGGFNVNLAPASTLLTGAIEVEVPPGEKTQQQSAEGASFTLYSNRDAARQGLSGPTVLYDFEFESAANLDAEAPVTLLGFQIGQVETAHLVYGEHSGKPAIHVTALLYARQLDLRGPKEGPTDWQSAADAKLRALLELGYRARLEQTPAVVGNNSIALVRISGAAPADLAFGGPHPQIPTAPGSSDLSDITSQVDQILAKVNRVPIEQIGRDLQRVTGRLQGLLSSSQVDDSLSHIHSALTEVDQMLAEVRPQLGPLLTKLNQTATEVSSVAATAAQLLGEEGGDAGDRNLSEAIAQLTEAARSIRTLADFLERHPEALIRGKRPGK